MCIIYEEFQQNLTERMRVLVCLSSFELNKELSGEGTLFAA